MGTSDGGKSSLRRCFPFVALEISLLVLASCGGGGGAAGAVSLATIQPTEACDGLFSTAGAQISFDNSVTCADCSSSDIIQARDGNFDSVSTISLANSAATQDGSFRVRATAPAGTSFPPGFAGALYGLPISAQTGVAVVGASVTSVFRTYLKGQLQETSVPGSSGPFAGQIPEHFLLQGLTTTKPFDSVELEYQWRSVSEPAVLRISEFCNSSKAWSGIAIPPRAGAFAINVDSPDAGNRYEIDLLILYTRRFQEFYGSRDIAHIEIEKLVAEANQYFQNSNVPVRYAIRDATLYGGASETLDTHSLLAVLASDPVVKAYRDRIGADVTVLLGTQDLATDLCGIGEPFNGSVQSATADNVDADFDSYAVLLIAPGQYRYGCPDQAFAHELGHVLAGGHEISGPLSSGGYWKPYSHAWTCGSNADGSSINTIMSTGAIDNASVFSSPLISRDGQACGQTGQQGVEATQADNARAITEAAPYVAGYRCCKSPPSPTQRRP